MPKKPAKPKQIQPIKNFSEPSDPRFKDTFFVVEATGEERQMLWCRHALKSPYQQPEFRRFRWEQDNPGFWEQIGTFGGWPIVITGFWEIIENRRVLFWEATSQLVHYPLCEEWLQKYVKTPRYNGNRESSCNAANFSTCLWAINEANKIDPRHRTTT